MPSFAGMSTWTFLREGLKNIGVTGTLTRSSPALCRSVIERIDFSAATLVVELGAGDGVITRHLLRRLGPAAQVVAFEVSPDLCAELQALNDPRLLVVNDSAEHLEKYLLGFGLTQVNAVVSAVPFTLLPLAVTQATVAAAYRCLEIGGGYHQIHYSLKTKEIYRRAFGNLSIQRVLFNLPPAFVLHCKKPA
ncbi:MAG: methyltransferase domain-containing protein [Lewinella sp.]|nr:methyltransferase domain-containing protein [Lewinella sp.]